MLRTLHPIWNPRRVPDLPRWNSGGKAAFVPTRSDLEPSKVPDLPHRAVSSIKLKRRRCVMETIRSVTDFLDRVAALFSAARAIRE
jgi:hypothetical protein